MKKYFLISGFLLIASFASAQKATVFAAFDKHKINHNVLDPKLKAIPKDLSYDVKEVSVTAGKEQEIQASYDPSQSQENKWTVKSVDGRAPKQSEINTFRNKHAEKENSATIDENTLKVESESGDQLVVSYKLNAAELPKEVAFLKDVRTFLTINTKTGKVEKLHSENEASLKVKFVNVSKLTIDLGYNYSSVFSRYLPVKQDMVMIIKFLGQSVSTETTTYYSNFKK